MVATTSVFAAGPESIETCPRRFELPDWLNAAGAANINYVNQLERPMLRLNGGICSDVAVPVSVLPIRALSLGLYTAHGDSRRNVDMLGGASGDVDVSFDLSLETTGYRVLTGSIAIDAPWPCSDQGLTFRFQRRPL